MKKKKSYTSSVLMTVYGLMLVIWPQASADILGYTIAGVILVIGISDIIRYLMHGDMAQAYKKELITGVIAIIIGLIFLVNVRLIQSIIPFLLGLYILYRGVMKLMDAFELRRYNYGNWRIAMILAAISIILGIVLTIKPLWLVKFIFRLIGIVLIYSGISDIITYRMYTNGVKKNLSYEDEIFQEQPKR